MNPPQRGGNFGGPPRGMNGGGPFDRNNVWDTSENGGGPGNIMNQPPPSIIPPNGMGGGPGGPRLGMQGGGGGQGKSSTQVTIPKDVSNHILHILTISWTNTC